MTTIWKYECKIVDDFDLELPAGAIFLTVQVQRVSGPCAWFEVEPNNPKNKRHFKWIGTGHKFDPGFPLRLMRYRGTIQIEELGLVFHLYEVLEE